jgi:hypothetical protein
MSQKQTLGLVGCGLLALGAFAPVVSVPFFGNINLFANGHGDGVFLLVLVGIGLLSVLGSPLPNFGAFIVGVLTGGFTIFDFARISSNLASLGGELHQTLKGNPFTGLGEAMTGSAQMQWGWLALLTGSCLLIYVGLAKGDAALNARRVTAPPSEQIPRASSTVAQAP